MGEEVGRSEGFGEQLLGLLLDRARLVPPQLIATLIAEEVAGIGGRDVSILLQDYAQEVLVPLAGRKLHVGQPEPMAGSPAGQAFLSADVVEVPQAHGGVRMFLPLLDGSDQVGVMALTLDAVGDADRRLLRRLAGLVADMLVTKNAYTDLFFLARRREPMSVSAEIQWSLLPPLTMTLPQVAVAGVLEPAYRVAGDSFDYALNGNILHMAVIDAMGHGLDAAVMATVAIGAYRHARRVFVSLAEKYAFMDDAISRHRPAARHGQAPQVAQAHRRRRPAHGRRVRRRTGRGRTGWETDRRAMAGVVASQLGQGVTAAWGLVAVNSVLTRLFADGPTADKLRDALPSLVVLAITAVGAALLSAWSTAMSGRLEPQVERVVSARYYASVTRVEVEATERPDIQRVLEAGKFGTDSARSMLRLSVGVGNVLIGMVAAAVVLASL
ncbi:hypothetical protein ABZ672_57225, partial [Streptomyces mirabilis]|uniref:PP2C family protein-serine/threonine phosphatase n=1 Tax=Streptomyces mirabilis TaxID=68239 RepID=UPI003476C540